MPFRLEIGRTPSGRPKRPKVWTAETTQRLLAGVMSQVVAQTERGLGIDGEQLGRLKSGAVARLRRTGAMMRGAAVTRATRTSGVAGFTASYARHVLKRFPNALGFPPDFGRTVDAVIEEGISTD